MAYFNGKGIIITPARIMGHPVAPCNVQIRRLRIERTFAGIMEFKYIDIQFLTKKIFYKVLYTKLEFL